MRRRLDDDEPQFHIVEDDEPDVDAGSEDVHHEGPDEPPVGREFYEEPRDE